jgi:putative transposase
VKVDPFIEAENVAGRSVNHACSQLEVSRSAYYERRNGVPSARSVTDAELTKKIVAIHAESKRTYGSPRIHKELGHRQVACGRRRVTRLMRIAGLEGRCKKHWRTTTVADPAAEAARDLIQRNFGPCEEMDRRYVGDITYIATWEGWAYLATVIDLANRRVVGWSLADHMRTELVNDALAMSFTHRAPERGVIFHSDRGSQGNTRATTSPNWPGPTVSSFRSAGRAAGTTPAGCTRRWATSAPPSTKHCSTTPTVRRHDQHKQTCPSNRIKPIGRRSLFALNPLPSVGLGHSHFGQVVPWPFERSGQVVLRSHCARVRSALLKSAPDRLALLRFAPDRLASGRWASFR